MSLILKKEHKEYRFIIAFIILEILLNVIARYIDVKGFALTPYFRIVMILFTVAFFSLDILKLKFKLKFKKTCSWRELFVYGWFFFALISILIGVLNKNPIIYIYTDFIYICLGAILFYIFRNKHNDKLDSFNLSKIILIIGLGCVIFNLKAPAILLVVIAALMFVNILNKRYLFFILFIIPYLILVFSSNRSQLIVFFLMIFLFLLKKFRNFFSTKSVIFFGLFIILFTYLFRRELISGLLNFINPESNIGYRINQISIILEEGIDYSDPFFTSISQRMIEAQVVFEIWTSSITSFIFGSGSGGVIDGGKIFLDNSVLESSLLGKNKVHNIHLLPFSMIFRHGLIGLMLFLVLLKIVYKTILGILNETKSEQKIFWSLLLIFWFFFSIPAASFLWSMPFFWISISFINKP